MAGGISAVPAVQPQVQQPQALQPQAAAPIQNRNTMDNDPFGTMTADFYSRGQGTLAPATPATPTAPGATPAQAPTAPKKKGSLGKKLLKIGGIILAAGLVLVGIKKNTGLMGKSAEEVKDSAIKILQKLKGEGTDINKEASELVQLAHQELEKVTTHKNQLDTLAKDATEETLKASEESIKSLAKEILDEKSIEGKSLRELVEKMTAKHDALTELSDDIAKTKEVKGGFIGLIRSITSPFEKAWDGTIGRLFTKNKPEGTPPEGETPEAPTTGGKTPEVPTTGSEPPKGSPAQGATNSSKPGFLMTAEEKIAETHPSQKTK